MKDVQITAPVTTLEGKELLPAGAMVNDDILRQLIAANPDTYKNVPLFRYDTVASDIRVFMSTPPYDMIYSNKKDTEHLLGLLEQVMVIQPVLGALDYFKANDYHTYRHSLMVYVLSCFMGCFIIPDFENHLKDIAGAPAHDFGKINVPLSVLKKQGPLNSAELLQIRHHSIAGYCLLCYYYKSLRHPAAILARDHHERRSGKGYPQGITDINTMTELVIISDVYDALLSPRSYRLESFDNRSALELITAMAKNCEISWDIVKLLTSQNRNGKPDYKTLQVSLVKRGYSPAKNNYGIIDDGE
jgi:HD-GYP domain-containing protein (c-di-GMP phosphodiesterase class II)